MEKYLWVISYLGYFGLATHLKKNIFKADILIQKIDLISYVV